jgi:HAMP domain-containing protein
MDNISDTKKSLVFFFSAVVTGGLALFMATFAVFIGVYDKNRMVEDLRSKAQNTTALASKSLVEPVWTFDEGAINGIVDAIWQDRDIAGIRLTKTGSKAPQLSKTRQGLAAFDELSADGAYLLNRAPLAREGQVIADIEILTSTQRADDQIRQSILLIALFSAVFVALVAAFIFVMARNLIKRPIDVLKQSAQELASGNLDLVINTQRMDELGSLAKSFDRMRESIKNMLGVIEAYNRDLEKRITERTAQLQSKTNDINAMLQNMRQGIFTIVSGGVIHSEFSAYLKEIFETQDIAGRNAASFIFDDSSVQSDALDTMTTTLAAIVGEEAMSFEFNSHLLCTEYQKQMPDGRTKILALDWNAVLDSDAIIVKLMVTVRDITEFKVLQVEAESQKTELEIIGQLLSVPKDKLEEFFRTSFEFFDENKAIIESTHECNRDVIATLFRNMHTVKGNARTYGFNHATDRLHEAESAYNLLRSHKSYEWNPQALLEQLDTARQSIDLYQRTYMTKLVGFIAAGAGGGSGGVYPAIVEKISAVFDKLNATSDLSAYREAFGIVRSTMLGVRYDRLAEILQGILSALHSMAAQLNKLEPEVVIFDGGVLIKREFSPVLRNVFMHLFRNSMDHGIEPEAERLSAGKLARGRIELQAELVARVDEEGLYLRFFDDGRGLALERIREKAIAEGRLSAQEAVEDEALAEMIFLSGVTTAQTLTEVSGRGVGMDAVRKFLNKHFGDIRVKFTGERVNGYRPFQLCITLPPSLATLATGD